MEEFPQSIRDRLQYQQHDNLVPAQHNQLAHEQSVNPADTNAYFSNYPKPIPEATAPSAVQQIPVHDLQVPPNNFEVALIWAAARGARESGAMGAEYVSC